MKINSKSFVAVTGIGVITSQAQSFESLIKNKISIWNKENKEVGSILPPEGLNSKELRRLSKLIRMAVSAADQSLRMANTSTDRMGTGVALTHGSTSYLAEFHDLMFTYGPDSASPSAFSNGVTNAPLSTISTMFKLTAGGVTFTGLESTGIEMLSFGADSILTNEYDAFLAGAAEEYSPVVEHIYSQLGWYNGTSPQFLPCEDTSTAGFGISEGSAFLVLETISEKSLSKAIALYCPVSNKEEIPKADLVLCGAGCGPQDLFEKNELLGIMKSSDPEIGFTNSVFGSCFALSGLLSSVLACACISSRCNLLPYVNISSDLNIQHTKQPVSSVLITGAGRDGQVAKGYFCSPEAAFL
jgi:hypothetical protein